MGKVDDKTLTDISGMAVGRRSRNVLWIHQSGSTSEVIALNRDGTTAKTFELGIAGSDIQDVAIGPGPAEGVDYIYLGDIGGRRSAISVFRFPEPRITTSAGVSDLVVIRLAYPDGPHSAQSLLADPISGDLLIATKESHRSRIYRAAPAQLVADSPSELELLIEVSFPNASAGDISSDGLLIVLRNETEARMWKRDSSETVDAALRRSGSAVAVVGTPREPDGDAIAFVPDSATYLTVSRDKKEHIFTFNPNSSGFESGTMTGELPESDLGEISGMVASRYEEDVFWVHNDGPIDRMFAIDGKGKVLVTLMLDRTLTDVEDIAASTSSGDGRAFLYLGDIGDNDSIRPTIGVLGFPEPQIPATAFRSPVTLNAQNSRWLPLSYPFRPSDAETLLFDGASGELLIATKEKSVSNLYRVPNTAPDSSETQVLEFVTDVPFSIASGGDVSQSGEEIVLRREDLAMLWTRTEGETLAQALLKSGREIPVMTPPIESMGRE
jgi:hypothetical protein